MSKIIIKLNEKDMINLQNIILDDDSDEALIFIKEVIVTQIPMKGTSNCDVTRTNPYLLKDEETEES